MNTTNPDVLIVDDELLARDRLQRLVEALPGWEVAGVCGSGDQALKLVGELNPSVVLLDIRMPGMDGFEVIERLKANVETRDIPVIFLTGESDGDTEHRAMELGAKCFVIKPIDVDTLIDAVNRTLSYSG